MGIALIPIVGGQESSGMVNLSPCSPKGIINSFCRSYSPVEVVISFFGTLADQFERESKPVPVVVEVEGLRGKKEKAFLLL